MKIRRLIKKAQSAFDADDRKTKEQKKSLKHVIKKLRKHEKSLQKRRKREETEANAAKLEDEIKLVHAQRKKGLQLLQELKKKS